MILKTLADSPGLQLADWKQIDAACDRFEAVWRAEGRPELADFLVGTRGPARDRLFRELLSLELEFRIRLGEEPEATPYRERFPEHLGAVDAAFAPGGAGLPSPSGPDRGEGKAWKDPAHDTESGTRLPRAALSPSALESLRSAGYEVLGELGRGGMGVVYLARKVALGRLCALKMIQAGAHAGPAAVARFQAEAAAVARLRHPDIVQIFHIGEVDDLPFLELEYVPGGSLDAALDGTPRPAAESARLVEVLARAIAEAHRLGVVHRDLKPANILLGADGHPRVADFGLAKFLDADDGLTRTHAILGSPSYMAPEQAEGRSRLVGAATDVYALGAILYELLTGRPPFRAATPLETLAQVKVGDPVPPSSIQPGLPRDVETICLKCLEKVAARRYATAERLAEDLRRYLAGEPILARPAPAWERAWKWARRRPTAATAAALGGAGVALLLGGTLYYNALLKNEVQRVTRAESAARKNARDAAEDRNLALRALNRLIYSERAELGESQSARPLRRRQLASAIQLLDEIGRRAEVAPPDLSRAAAHQRLGDIYRQVGEAAEARRQYEQALRLAERLDVATPGVPEIAECLRGTDYGLGALSMNAGSYPEARDRFRRVVGLAERIFEAEPGREGARQSLLEAYLQLGRANAFRGDLPEAGAWFRKMHDLAERWSADEPTNARVLDMLASSYRKLADNAKLSKRPEEARGEYLKAIEIGRRALAADPGNPAFKGHLAIALNDLAGVARHAREFAEAGPLFREADRLFGERAEADPESLDAESWLIRSRCDLARLERDELRFEAAADLFRSAIRRLSRLERSGRLKERAAFEARRIRALEREVADCQDAPAALGDLDSVRSRPAPEAARLLRIRARAEAAQGRWPALAATLDALGGLDDDRPEVLYGLAGALASCLGDLDGGPWAGPPTAEWPGLRGLCADRGLAALSKAVARGFRDAGRLEGDEAFAPLRGHPAYRALIGRLHGPPPPSTGGDGPPAAAGRGPGAAGPPEAAG